MVLDLGRHARISIAPCRQGTRLRRLLRSAVVRKPIRSGGFRLLPYIGHRVPHCGHVWHLPSRVQGRRFDWLRWPRPRGGVLPHCCGCSRPPRRRTHPADAACCWQAADFLGVRGLLDALICALSTTLAARTPDEGMAFLGLRRPDASACSVASARALLEKHAVCRAPAHVRGG